MLITEKGLNLWLENWLNLGIISKFCLLGGLGFLGLISFLIFAKLTKVLDICAVLRNLKRNNNAKAHD